MTILLDSPLPCIKLNRSTSRNTYFSELFKHAGTMNVQNEDWKLFNYRKKILVLFEEKFENEAPSTYAQKQLIELTDRIYRYVVNHAPGHYTYMGYWTIRKRDSLIYRVKFDEAPLEACNDTEFIEWLNNLLSL